MGQVSFLTISTKPAQKLMEGHTDRQAQLWENTQADSQTDRQTDAVLGRPYIDEALDCSDGDDVEERQGKEGAPHCHKAQLPLPAPPPAKHMAFADKLCSAPCIVLVADHCYNVCKIASANANTSSHGLKLTCATDIDSDLPTVEKKSTM